MKKIVFLLILLTISSSLILDVHAQCAMCRATVESNVSQSEGPAVGAGLNTGILYLMAVPYILAVSIGFLMYRESKRKKSSGEGILGSLKKMFS